MLNKKYRMVYDGHISDHRLQKRKFWFWWEDVMVKTNTINGIDIIEPFCSEESLSESEAVRYFKLKNFDPNTPEPDFMKVWDDPDEMISSDEYFTAEEVWKAD